MAGKPVTEQIGDIFVSETSLTMKLLPSNKEKSKPISWFSKGCVTNVHLAAKDIAALAGKLGGRTSVRGLTVMTDLGSVGTDLDKTGLGRAVEKAGFEIIR